MTLRKRTYAALNPPKLNALSWCIIVIILLAIASAVLETEPLISAGRDSEFRTIELTFAAIFIVEYAARIWAAAEGPKSRFRYALTPAALIDLVALIGALLPFFGADVLILRLARVLRMVRVARLGRFSRAFAVMENAIRSRAAHLWVAFSLAVFFLIFSATLMYWAEGSGQPDEFGSIPRAMWWAVATMTTVGYGDVVPYTGLGRLIGGFVSISGIVLIAIPTGIMAAAFSDQLCEQQDSERDCR